MVFGANNAQGLSPKAYEETNHPNVTVTYSSIVGDIATVSGYQDDRSRVFYERDVVGAGSINGIGWSYPAADKAIWDPIVTRTASTFQPGDLTSGH